jgi:hypothetical protein
MICIDTVSTASLTSVTCADIIAVEISIFQDGNSITAPTFLLILGTCIYPARSKARSDALVVGVCRSAAVDVGGKLATWVVLSITANVAVASAAVTE